MKYLPVLLCCVFLSLLKINSIYSQDLPGSRQSSYYTYIYRISDKQAKVIYKDKLWKVDAGFFHTLVDSFPTDSQYQGELQPGHYLKTYADKNRQRFSITTVQDFNVYILNNNTDLNIQVVDLDGNIIDDARVSVRWKNLRYDEEIRSYIDKKSNQQGLLKVTHNGFTTFYNLSRDRNKAFFSRRLLYRTPLKYIWKPIRYVVLLPIDGVRSVVWGWPTGTIYRTKSFFVNSYYKTLALFDNGFFNPYRFKEKHKGYIVFNKPKYFPGDTLKLKAYITEKKGKAIEEDVKVVLAGRDGRDLATVSPHRPGAYHLEFHLHDSLNLKLDSDYQLVICRDHKREYLRGSFRYEDYELSKINLSLRKENKEHHRNEKMRIYASGTDENELNLLDARLEVMLKPKQVNRFYTEQEFIPDTLFFIEMNLDPGKETLIELSDSLFPRADFVYTAEVRLLTSDNEAVSKTEDVYYFYETGRLNIELQADSVYFEYTENEIRQEKQVIITARDNFGNTKEVYQGGSPVKIVINPYFLSYTVEAGNIKKTINISAESSLLNCFSDRTNDSINITVDNPRKIPFVYNIYRRNKQVAQGYSDSLNFRKKTRSRQTYLISIRYLWAGAVKEENYTIPSREKKLNISVSEPKIIYPGQESRIAVQVTDNKGRPVQGVDLTAYSLTKKFNYSPPDIPYLGKTRKNKKLINNFRLRSREMINNYAGLSLDYDLWKELSDLDSIEYYRFIYPEGGLYIFNYTPEDSITQFAPFVVSGGSLEPVHIVYIDNKPLYFSWVNPYQPYSFAVNPGVHQVRLRTSRYEIEIRDVHFEEGKKLILSLDTDKENSRVKLNSMDSDFSRHEKQIVRLYTMPFINSFGDKLAYVKDGNRVHLLHPSAVNSIGPVAGHRLSFKTEGQPEQIFKHEADYVYEFMPGQIKMKNADINDYPFGLNNYKPRENLADRVLPEEEVLKVWTEYYEKKRSTTGRYNNPNITGQGAGRLHFFLDNKDEDVLNLPLNIVCFAHHDPQFIRVYPGGNTIIHDMAEGHYKIAFFYQGAEYHIEDSVFVKADGLNFYRFKQPDLKKDDFSRNLGEIIDSILFNPDNRKDENKTRFYNNNFQQQFNYSGLGKVVQGFVFDNEESPLPGVTITIKGTSYGTVTDIEGYYSINLPPWHNDLVFSFIGFDEEEVYADQDFINVYLTPSMLALEEVVVIAYGVSSSGYADMEVTAEALQGSVHGINVDNNTASDFMALRAASNSPSSISPLIVINGRIFTGDISEIDPALITSMEILKESQATALYGPGGKNGVVVIETKPGAFDPEEPQTDKADENPFGGPLQANSIRDNFSDYAFWQPNLVTDEQGRASFEVTFPDDVTSWETFYLAMNDKRQSGQTRGIIKSYRPLMAQLALPRFMVQADTVSALGKILNYSPGKPEVKRVLEIDKKEIFNKSAICEKSIIDTLLILAESDTLNIKYYLETRDGYLDGEQRKIPVFAQGLEETTGRFYVLDKDTTLNLSFDPGYGQVSLNARADLLEVLKDEIRQVVFYRYDCNEQLASKLKALLASRAVTYYNGEKFRNDKEVEKLIRKLLKNKKEQGLWGWWKDSPEELWISLHVLEALTKAEQSGYRLGINKRNISELLIYRLEKTDDFNQTTRILRILNLLDTKADYHTWIKNLEDQKAKNLNEMLNLMEVKLMYNIDVDLDTLEHWKKTTLFGNIFYSDPSGSQKRYQLLNNNLLNTLMAYRILKSDPNLTEEVSVKIINYFLEERSRGSWRNTYESVKIIETLLPALLKGKPQTSLPVLTIGGDLNDTITEFPFEMRLAPSHKISLTKTGDFPVYLSSHQTYWNNSPAFKAADFEINTSLNDNMALTAGGEYKLIVKVNVKKDADYVMINVPIPAGCSYNGKRNYTRHQSHREYFKNETVIFCDFLPQGEHIFEVDLIARYSGTFTLNPAKVELMYFPTFNANEEMKRVRVN